MISNPKLSVVMPAYNAGAYLRGAVTSILDQTFRNFEFIIVNDGSSDTTASILQEYERLDSRIKVVHQDNQGMISALNRGCRLARGRYIARMDADDISLPQRFERQLEYIESHPQIGILGTWIRKVRNELAAETWCPPTNPKMLKWSLFFGVCVAHPTVLMRREVLEKLNFYRHGTVHIEDVDLWLRASFITDFGNVPEVLLMYRTWPGSVTQTHHQFARDAQVRLLASFVTKLLNIQPPIEAIAGLRQMRVGPRIEDPQQIRLTAALIQDLYHNFTKENYIGFHERREISWDAAKKVASLALQASRFDTRASVSLLVQALQLDYRLLYPSAIMRGLERAFEQRL